MAAAAAAAAAAAPVVPAAPLAPALALVAKLGTSHASDGLVVAGTQHAGANFLPASNKRSMTSSSWTDLTSSADLSRQMGDPDPLSAATTPAPFSHCHTAGM
jgi:predicted dienelactone hydrolase